MIQYSKMPTRKQPLATGQMYHVIVRSLDKRPLFRHRDYQRFTELLAYYQRDELLTRFSSVTKGELSKILNIPPQEKLVEIVCYCLMPNHIHLLLRQEKDGGISKYMRLILDSYTRYFNIIDKRKGALFEGRFKAVLIEDDEQLIHVSRYIHLNPAVSFVVKELKDHPWSSYRSFLNPKFKSIIFCFTRPILEHFSSGQDYNQFVIDHKDYAQQLEKIKHLILE